MSLEDIDGLPEVITDGLSGHKGDHEKIHSALKALKAKLEETPAIPSADDIMVQVTDPMGGDLVYRSLTELSKGLIFSNTGELEDVGVSLQGLTASLYIMVMNTMPASLDRIKMIPGSITVGVVDLKNGFMRDPRENGFNMITSLTFFLDSPSTSGAITLRFVSIRIDGSISSWSGEIFTIPENGRIAEFPDVSLDVDQSDQPTFCVVEILTAGTGASGLTVQAARTV